MKNIYCLSLVDAREFCKNFTFDAKLSLKSLSNVNYFNYLSDNRRKCVYIQREKSESKNIFETYNENVEKQKKQKMFVYMSNSHFSIWSWHHWKDIECHDVFLTYSDDVIVIDIFIWDHILEILLSHEYANWVNFSSLSFNQVKVRSA